jgi:hypothetical protein
MKQAILGHMRHCDDRDKFPRFLPTDSILAHKTGSTERVRNDAGILFLPDCAVAIGVLTADNVDGMPTTPAHCSAPRWPRKSTSISASASRQAPADCERKHHRLQSLTDEMSRPSAVTLNQEGRHEASAA